MTTSKGQDKRRGQAYTRQVQCRFTAEDHDALSAIAADIEKPISELVRRIVHASLVRQGAVQDDSR